MIWGGELNTHQINWNSLRIVTQMQWYSSFSNLKNNWSLSSAEELSDKFQTSNFCTSPDLCISPFFSFLIYNLLPIFTKLLWRILKYYVTLNNIYWLNFSQLRDGWRNKIVFCINSKTFMIFLIFVPFM